MLLVYTECIPNILWSPGLAIDRLAGAAVRSSRSIGSNWRIKLADQTGGSGRRIKPVPAEMLITGQISRILLIYI